MAGSFRNGGSRVPDTGVSVSASPSSSTPIWFVPPVADTSSGISVTEHVLAGSLTIATFNILAPCWKPMRSDWDNEEGHPTIWKDRANELVKVIINIDADIICLQEYWFNAQFREFFEGKSSPVAAKYECRAFRRTGRKPDGVATFVRRPESKSSNRWSYTIADTVNVPFNDVGQRVALMLRIHANHLPHLPLTAARPCQLRKIFSSQIRI